MGSWSRSSRARQRRWEVKKEEKVKKRKSSSSSASPCSSRGSKGSWWEMCPLHLQSVLSRDYSTSEHHPYEELFV